MTKYLESRFQLSSTSSIYLLSIPLSCQVTTMANTIKSRCCSLPLLSSLDISGFYNVQQSFVKKLKKLLGCKHEGLNTKRILLQVKVG